MLDFLMTGWINGREWIERAFNMSVLDDAALWLLSQPLALIVVIIDCLNKLLLGNRKEFDFHLLFRSWSTASKGRAEILRILKLPLILQVINPLMICQIQMNRCHRNVAASHGMNICILT